MEDTSARHGDDRRPGRDDSHERRGLKSVSGDSGSVEQHSIPDQIAADRYLASKKASRAKGLGVRMTKVVPPGAV
jgi:hypothetical protein